MSKVKDSNGFWVIKHNPISKVGVFPYMGRSISDDCEPNKVYYVYRSADTLSQSVPTWDNPPKPFIDDHEMLGEGFSKVDDRPVQGVISNPVFENDTLYADISVYSESLKDKIANGKKELSLGYFCKYRKEKGVYKGQAYDYVQEDMVGNHIALVDNGRCGSDVKVFDSKCTMDSLDLSGEAIEELKTKPENATITTTETKDSKMKYISVDALRTILDEALEEEKAKEVSEKVEAKASDEEEKEEEKKSEDKCGKDEEKKEEEKKSEDEAEEEKKETEDEEVSPADVMAFLKMILEEVRHINGKKTTDEDEEKKDEKAEDEDEEKKESEDEDDDEKKESEDEDDDEKKAEDSADITITFAKDGADKPVSFMDDPELRKYLNI